MASRFVPSVEGYRQLMKSAPIAAMVNRAAEQMASSANSMCSDNQMRNNPFETSSGTDDVAAYARVFTASPHGRRAQAKNKVLTKALKSTRV